MKTQLVSGMVIIGALTMIQWVSADELAKKVNGQVDTIAGYLKNHPEMTIDFTEKSGEYCLNTWKVGGSHMTHYATDPSMTVEDVIDFVKLSSLNGTVDINNLPRAPTGLGLMKPNQWYYLPKGQYDPHHGKPAKADLLVRATNIE